MFRLPRVVRASPPVHRPEVYTPKFIRCARLESCTTQADPEVGATRLKTPPFCSPRERGEDRQECLSYEKMPTRRSTLPHPSFVRLIVSIPVRRLVRRLVNLFSLIATQKCYRRDAYTTHHPLSTIHNYPLFINEMVFHLLSL